MSLIVDACLNSEIMQYAMIALNMTIDVWLTFASLHMI